MRVLSLADRGGPPFWLWTQVLRSYVLDRGRDELGSEIGPRGGILADLVPEIRQKLPDLARGGRTYDAVIAACAPPASRFQTRRAFLSAGSW
jgi:hypothetical protein